MKNRNVSQVPSQPPAPTAAENGAFVDVEKIQDEENKKAKKGTTRKD